MSHEERIVLEGSEGALSVRVWPHPDPARIVVIAHGYGEHIGRYEHVAAALGERGAAVFGPDHLGHGQSAGEPVLIEDFELVVEDLHRVVEIAKDSHPELPLVLIGHSMGGLVATRYVQEHGDELAGLVLSGPAIGLGPVLEQWVQEPPTDPIDVAVLSRDPGVGEAYANDPLVWQGGWKQSTLEAFLAANQAVDAGSGFGELPTLYVHGEADELIPMDFARPAVERLGGSDFDEHIITEARHEVFNELEKDETIALVADFVERTTDGR